MFNLPSAPKWAWDVIMRSWIRYLRRMETWVSKRLKPEKQSTHSCLVSIWCRLDGNMALPLFLHGYCVLALKFNSPHLCMGCHEMNGVFSTYFICLCQLSFSPFSESLWGVLFLLPLLWWIPQMESTSFSQTGSSLKMGSSALSIILGTSQKEQMIPLLFSPLNPAVVVIKDLASFHSINIYWDLLYARYCSRYSECTESEPRELAFWGRGGKRDWW